MQFKRYKLVSVLNAGDELDSLAEKQAPEVAVVNITLTSDLLATFRAAAISVFGANSDTISQSRGQSKHTCLCMHVPIEAPVHETDQTQSCTKLPGRGVIIAFRRTLDGLHMRFTSSLLIPVIRECMVVH